MSSASCYGDTVNLFYPLCEAAAYAGSPFLDMVLGVVPSSDGTRRKLRLWLQTPADHPEVEINAHRFAAVGKSVDGLWIDYGAFTEDPDELGVPRFAIIRFHGITAEEAGESWCVLTSQTDIALGGGVHDAERALQGISRAEAGTSTLSPSRVRVGSAQAFTLTYRAGPRGLRSGTLLRLAFPKAFSRPQAADRHADGWLAPLDNGAVTLLSIDTSTESHERIDVCYRLEKDLEPADTLRFGYRTRFVYLFPMTWQTMERRYWWSHLPVMAPAVAVDDRRVFVAPLEANGHTLQVEPGPVERLFLFLPGRVRAKTEITLTGLFTDRYRNIPARSPLPADFELILTGEEERPLASPEKHFAHWCRFEMPLADLKPGVYRVSAVDSASGSTLATSNPLQVIDSDSPLSPIYWGEIHGHSEQSDGSGDYHDMFVYAKECGLDFAAAADHACYHTDNEWQWMQDVVNAHNRDHRFVTLIGYEWAGQQGHRNVYTSRDRLDLFRGMTPGQKTLDVVYDHFAGDEEVVAGPHVHHTKDFYAGHNSQVQRFMEIYSMWGDYEALAFDILNRGARIGLTGGGDCHEGHCGFSVEDERGQGVTPHTFAPGLKYRCGMTAALLPSLTRQDLLHALRHGKTYATTGARILLDFSLSGLPMGEEGRLDGESEICAQIHACGPVETVEVVKNGVVVYSLEDQPQDCALNWTDNSGEGGWYIVRVLQKDGQKAWSSPIWIRTNGQGNPNKLPPGTLEQPIGE